MTPQELVESYLANNYRVIFWPAVADRKGPTEPGWPQKIYTIEDYEPEHRVGILTGTEIQPDHFLHDVDLDWTPGSLLAQSLLPLTSFVFGRPGKRVSHCFYTAPEPIPSVRYEDIDKTCLIELRGTKNNGDLGLQTMVPPSIWSKGAQRELLTFVRSDGPSHIDAAILKHRVCLAAVGMILAKNLGTNGFGHEARLAWAGFLLRVGISVDDLVLMGEAISVYCHNTEVHDVRRTVESTALALAQDGKKVKGGPALARLLGTHGRSIITRINEWLGRYGDFVRSKEGKILAKHQGNIKRAIELLGHELSYNQFSDKLLLNGQPMEDRQVDSIALQIEADFHFQPPDTYFEKVLMHVAWTNGFHPVKDYLNGLTWDGVPRIDEWLITCACVEDTEYTRAVSSILLIAGVKRIRHPGCKYDEMVVWESDQGAEKSSAAQALCPNPAWFSDDLALNLRSQQVIEATLGKWIVEASDLAGKRKTEIEQLKAMLSRQVDGPARMAYAHFPVERPRHFIIIGTTNSTAYLTDPTGARRFWPMKVERFNVAWIKEHRDQLWAEACVRESAGESIRLSEALWPAATEHQEARREIDPWEGVLRNMLIGIEANTDGKKRVTTSALWEALGILMDRRDRYGSLRISDIMQRLGFRRTRVRPQGEDVQVGYVQEYDRLELVGGEGLEEKSSDVPF